MADTPFFFIDQSTFDSWVDALGFAAASKLMGACAAYYFTGELSDDVKLTKVARALFEGERARLDARRAKAAAKSSPRTPKATRNAERPNVEKSAAPRKNSQKVEEKSSKSSGKVAENSAPTTHLPAKTPTHPKTNPKPKPNDPQTPAQGEGARGSGAMGRDEFLRLASGGLGFTGRGAYGLRAV